jgi:hypothetical protein
MINYSLNHSLGNDSPEYKPKKRPLNQHYSLNLSESSPNSDNSEGGGKAEVKLPRVYSASKKIKLPPICNLIQRRNNIPNIPFRNISPSL